MALILRGAEVDAAFTQRIRGNIPRRSSVGDLALRFEFQRRLRFPTAEELLAEVEPALLPVVSLPVSLVTPAVAEGGIGACLGLGGGVISFSASVTAGTTVVLTSDLLPFPFVINHIQWSIAASEVEDIRIRFRVAPTIETDTALESGWEPVILPWSNPSYHVSVGVGTIRQQFPNFRVPATLRAIKCIIENNLGVDRRVQAEVSIQRLD